MSAIIRTGQLGIRVLTGSGALNPSFRIDQNLSISGTINGHTAILSTDPNRAGACVSLTCNGVQYIYSAAPGPHGAEIEWAHNILEFDSDATSWNRWSPTEDGRQNDGSSTSLCTSNCLERWVSDDGRNMRVVTKAAFWGDPGESITPGKPVRNVRPLSEMIGTTEHQWGFQGNDGIILRNHTLVIPANDPIVNVSETLVPIPLTLYVPKPEFPNMWSLDLSTGIYTPYAGYPASSRTSAIVIAKSDGTAAICPLLDPATFGTGIGYQGYEIPANNNSAFIICREKPVGGMSTIQGQTRSFRAAIAVGEGANSLNDVKASALQLNNWWLANPP